MLDVDDGRGLDGSGGDIGGSGGVSGRSTSGGGGCRCVPPLGLDEALRATDDEAVWETEEAHVNEILIGTTNLRTVP
jgi:hypothetical protein